MELWFDRFVVLNKAANILENEGIEARLEKDRLVVLDNYKEACHSLDNNNINYAVA